MNVSTKYFGEIEVNNAEIITFSSGLPAFENENAFLLLPFDVERESPFHILQSANTPDLAFVVGEIFQFFPDYQANLPDSDMLMLNVKDARQVALWGLITVKDPFQESTMNLAAPLVINADEKLAKQSILQDANYDRKARLFQAEKEGASCSY